MVSALCNGLLVLVLLALLLLYVSFMPDKSKRKLIRDEIRRGLKDGSIEANMGRK